MPPLCICLFLVLFSRDAGEASDTAGDDGVESMMEVAMEALDALSKGEPG